MVKIVVLASAVLAAYALKDLPERARHGRAVKHVLGGTQEATSTSEPQFWQSKCDHFNSGDNSTFAQKYYINDQFWDGTGPVFIEIGGEGTLSPPSGYVVTLAEKYKAMVVALEHRFYGNSIPNGNVFTENLKLLSVEQALADLNAFTSEFKSTIRPETSNALWFGFGGSYPGALASWYRIAYPDATVGTLSSSGVVNCIIDYDGFDKQVTAAIGNQCADQIRRIESAFERQSSTAEGWKKSLDQFYCEPDMSTQDFYYMIADSWSMADQYSAKSQLCGAILAPGTDSSDEVLTQTFADFSNSFWGNKFCTGGFYNTKQLSDPARWDTNSRSWRWQTCYQVSYFNTAPAQGSLRNKIVDLDYHLKQCEEVFGTKMFPSSLEMNFKYGGSEPKAHNVFYSDFSDDPWARASVDYGVSTDQPYYLSQCNDCGHCKDLHTPSSSDPEPIQQSRKEFEFYLNKWLTEAAAAKQQTK